MKHYELSGDIHLPESCDRFCKVHNYWDFESQQHLRLPTVYNILSSRRGWVSQRVHVGPPAYYPRKPTYNQAVIMNMRCPHDQMDLTCSTCLRHTFHPLEIK